MGIWDDNAFVVDCIQGGVHKSNLRNLAGNGFQLNEIAALEGLADEDLKPAGKLGDAVLQADAGRHAGAPRAVMKELRLMPSVERAERTMPNLITSSTTLRIKGWTAGSTFFAVRLL